MKKRRYIVSGIFAVIIVCVALFLFLKQGDKPMESKFPFGEPTMYKNIDRELTLENFSSLTEGLSYEAVVEIIGEPNGTVGSGLVYYFYELTDGHLALLSFGSKGQVSVLTSIKIYYINDMTKSFYLEFNQ